MEGLHTRRLPHGSWVLTRILRQSYTVQPAYMKRFGAAKTVPYIQKNHVREVHLYIYILGSIARET